MGGETSANDGFPDTGIWRTRRGFPTCKRKAHAGGERAASPHELASGVQE
ncbi:MAG: hypothetical protein KME49_15945 [Brasilonema octagenarum HA4186-MV1]|nr:hypothetical protein [Brasilonema octagenarum]MBW4626947.1 hypothetical protein [Brasilonema octagenarum HA4186-MV1]